MHKSNIIILNGTSSSGKSTISKNLREKLPTFCYFASDQLDEEGFRPILRSPLERKLFFDGFHRSIKAFADSGCNLIVEHIFEEVEWVSTIKALLRNHIVFWVGVHCPDSILQERERSRGNRTIGEALYHLKTHQYCSYDLEVDSSLESSDIIACRIKSCFDVFVTNSAN